MDIANEIIKFLKILDFDHLSESKKPYLFFYICLDEEKVLKKILFYESEHEILVVDKVFDDGIEEIVVISIKNKSLIH